MFGFLKDMPEERKFALGALGQGMSQLAAGQPVNLGPAHQALLQRQQDAEARKQVEALSQRFTPDQRAILASMPPAAAIQVIAGDAFRAPNVPQPTDDMREYELAVAQGYQGTLEDWILGQRSAGATTVNVGSDGVDYGRPPTDMAWLRNTDGTVQLDERGAPMAVVVAGSETDRKQREALTESASAAIDRAEAAKKGGETTLRSGSIVLEDINRVTEKIEAAPWYQPTAGFFGNIFKNVAGTDAADVKALTTTIRSNIGFDRLQAMRESSPTGGALGNVTVQELERLESVLGSIEQTQSEPQLLENLDRLEAVYIEIMRKASAYPNAAEFGFDVTTEPLDDPLGLFR